MKITLSVNDRSVDVDVAPSTMLVDVLRDELGITSARATCGVGLCGTCTVLLDGRPVSSCLLMAPLAIGKRITTVEGLPDDDAVVRCFSERHAFQCGFCIPGMVLTARDMIDTGRANTPEEIREGLGGNLCRCGCYVKIVDAIEEAAR
ncbi:(2Fe-2S)-binding protein [Actinobacteria bacterium YIM 96077]|uniref:(2Fe-2S)-binding protein n=1 Tax=Phytoactinopolyspora halophila TaxID=1981511 RepID=A0A329QAU1_9ACTN|nr:(2Fe-2S)-binding protein [Phytoactinopolyspora halophila]AYY13711.1 (2Fe-2S)-binding protein [Actinobacteria bacterium YIM 96077]RAW09357.1 (2Fe-2S)-binding protein [Phytoactinopolyspora halophila]